MTSRERVYKALRFEKPDRIPRDLWMLPGIRMFRASELRLVHEHYPVDIVLPVDTNGDAPSALRAWGGDIDDLPMFQYGRSRYTKGDANRAGVFVDEWGCPFEAKEDGVCGEVKRPPLADWKMLDEYIPPREILDDANWDAVNPICARSSKFILTPWHIDPFERMQFLRGTEALFMDLACGAPEIIRLRDRIHEFFLGEIELWCETDVDAIRVADDWGAQNALLISPSMWREIFKPLYAEYSEMIHSAGKFFFMHSDGFISDIIPDFIEIGVDALNSQLFCMDIEALARNHRGKITFWGEIDRQKILPFGRPDDVRRAVQRVRKAFDTGIGGVIAQLEWGKCDSMENIEAAFEEWLK